MTFFRIGRLEVGIWTRPSGKYSWRDWLRGFYLHTACGCYMLEIGRLAFTWLAGYCWVGREKD